MHITILLNFLLPLIIPGRFFIKSSGGTAFLGTIYERPNLSPWICPCSQSFCTHRIDTFHCSDISFAEIYSIFLFLAEVFVKANCLIYIIIRQYSQVKTNLVSAAQTIPTYQQISASLMLSVFALIFKFQFVCGTFSSPSLGEYSTPRLDLGHV